MDRREFLKSGLFSPFKAFNTKRADANSNIDDLNIIGSHPALQNYASVSMGVAFAVKCNANGYVTYWKENDPNNKMTVYAGGNRVTDMNDYVMLVRLTNLEPSTTYNYLIGAYQIDYKNGYDTSIVGHEELGNYKFTTAGINSSSHFCVFNDTHANRNNVIDTYTKLIDKFDPAFVVWNGDAANREENMSSLVKIFLNIPNVEKQDYAANLPYLFCPGNHDQRGKACRHLEKAWMYRQPEERLSRDWDLGRNFAVRSGDIALIGMDTGEDKLDSNKIFAGLFNNVAYREAQQKWLEYALELPEIKSAPFLICACHIPLTDNNPRANGADVAPDDTDFDHYKHDYTDWQKTCAKLWTPLLEKHGCQLVIAAHTHLYKYDAPTSKRPWAQINGGGNDLQETGGFATLFDVDVKLNKLVVKAYNAYTEKLLDTYRFDPRDV